MPEETTTTAETEDTTTAAGEGTETAKVDDPDWKALARKHERQAKANATKAKRLDELEAANKTDAEKAAAERDALSTKATAATARAIKAEIKAAASTLKFRDPGDAARLLDLDDLTDADGEVDEDAINTALKKIAKNKPYLLAETIATKSGADFSAGTGTGGGPTSVEDFRKLRNNK